MLKKGKQNILLVVGSWRTLIIAAFSLSIGYALFRAISPWLDRPNNPSAPVVRYEEAMTKGNKRVGMLTFHNIVPGGVERYFLTSARAFQLQGFRVDILVKSDNRCKTIEFVRATAEFLRIELDYRKLSLKVIRVKGNRIQRASHSYDIFFVLGNQKIPQVFGLGKNLNIYMCQFPFDLGRPSDEAMLNIISEYDIVLVNSLYTLGWYAKVIQPAFNQSRVLGKKTPSVQILYPPVDPYIAPLIISQPSKNVSNLSSPAEVIKIVLLGRFFSGRQNKGHKVAIKLLEKLRNRSTKSFEMTLIGSILPSKDADVYVEELKSYVALHQLPVTFLLNAEPSDIAVKLSEATAFWQLTGIKDENSGAVDDPGSLEHFGIAVVEAMSMGCIPIVLKAGGTVDIVEHGKSGFLANTATDYITHTLSLASMSANKVREMKAAAVNQSTKFHVSRFINKLQIITHRALLAYPLRRVAHFFAAKMAHTSQGDMRLVLRVGPGAHTRLAAFFSSIVPKQSYQRLPVSFTTAQSEEGLSQEMLQDALVARDAVASDSLTVSLVADSVPFHDFHAIKVASFPSRFTAVIVEPTIDSAFAFSVRTTMYRLGPTWGLQVFHSKENFEFVKASLADMKNVRYVLIKDTLLDITHYNRLLKSEAFWASLKSAKVLLFQSDSVILKSGVSKYMEYDYAGAPWRTNDNIKIMDLRDKGWLPIAVGNGGFSIRNVSLMQKVIKKEGPGSPDTENEDIFFSQHIQRVPGARVSPESVAYEFCKEENIPTLELSGNRLTSHFALHAAWYYNAPDRISELLLSAVSPSF